MRFDINLPADPWAVGLYIAAAIFVLFPALAMLTAVGFWMLAHIAPIRWILLAWLELLMRPARVWLGELVREETQEIRAQVMPNGGTSMNDRLAKVLFELEEQAHGDLRVEQDFGAFEAVLLEVRGRLADITEKVYEIDARTSTERVRGGTDAETLRTGRSDQERS